MQPNFLIEDSVYTERFPAGKTPRLPSDTTILTGPAWAMERDGGAFLTACRSGGASIIELEVPEPGAEPWRARRQPGGVSLDLRDDQSTFESLGCPSRIMIDINTLGLGTWAPILRMCRRFKCASVSAVYLKPATYRLRSCQVAPVQSPEYDFNTTALGIRPVAGFGRLPTMSTQDGARLIALLGLEGKRAHVALRELGDPIPRTVPVFAVPGYSRRLTQRAIWAHRDFLLTTETHERVYHVPPTNPFYVLRFIEGYINSEPNGHIYIMPMATKPMNLGAVLACVRHPHQTELVFDHPLRSPGPVEQLDAYYVFDVTHALSDEGGDS